MDASRPRFLAATAATAAAAARALSARKVSAAALDDIRRRMEAIRRGAGSRRLPRLAALAGGVADALAIAALAPDAGLIQALKAGCERIDALARGAADDKPKGSDEVVLLGLAAMAGAARRLERARLFAGRAAPAPAADECVPAGGPGSRSWPLSEALEHLGAVAEDIAEEAGKEIVLTLDVGGVRAGERTIAALVPTLVQLIRCAVADGIEFAPQRLAAGKPAAGRILLSARRRGRRIAVEIADDGRGTATPNLADRHDAAARRIASLGGTLALRSEPGQGAAFTIHLPDAPARMRRRRPARTPAAAADTASAPAAPNWS